MRRILAVIATVLLAAIPLWSLYNLFNHDTGKFHGVVAKLTPEADVKIAQGYYDRLRSEGYASLSAELDTAIMSPDIPAQLKTAHDMLPDGAPRKTLLVNYQWRTIKSLTDQSEWRTVTLIMEQVYTDKTVLFDVSYIEKDGQRRIQGIHVNPDALQLKEAARFRLTGLQPAHYIALAVALVFTALNLWAFYICLATPGLKWKWAWAIFIAFGIGVFNFEWNSARIVNWQVLYINLPVASFIQALYQSAIIKFSVPLGAFLFLLRHTFEVRKRVAKSEQLSQAE